MNADKIL